MVQYGLYKVVILLLIIWKPVQVCVWERQRQEEKAKLFALASQVQQLSDRSFLAFFLSVCANESWSTVYNLHRLS